MDFAAELAELEWCMVEAVHAPASEPLASDQVNRLASSNLADAKLLFNPSLHVREFTYPVNSYFQKWVDGLSPALPEPHKTVTAIFRSGYRIVRATISPARAALLGMLLDGAPISAALARMQQGGLLDNVDAPLLTSWFQRWIAEGWVAGVELRGGYEDDPGRAGIPGGFVVW
jgi:hypothetical protein